MGVPLLTVRNVLRAWRTSSDAAHIASRANVRLGIKTTMVLLDELRDRGFIVDGASDYDGLTEKGHTLAIADGRVRTSKKVAWKKFEEFLSACAAVNARNDLPFYVDKVWLFGSMIDSAKTDVGDIDFVVELGNHEKMGTETRTKTYERIGRELGIRPDSSHPFRHPIFLVPNRLLYGPRRHPLLNPSPLNDLEALACPCQLVFAKRDGRVLGPILPKHPNATKKKGIVRGRFELSDLFGAPADLRPLPADIIDPRRLYYVQLTETGPWAADSPCYRFVQDNIRNAFPIMSNELPSEITLNVVTRKLDIGQCDARRRSGLLMTEHLFINPKNGRGLPRWRAEIDDKDGHWNWEMTHRATYGAVVERSIQQHKDRVIYSVFVLDEVLKSRFSGEFEKIWSDEIRAAHYWFHLLATADIERIRRRDAEAGIGRSILVSVTSSKGSGLARDLAESLSQVVEEQTPLAKAGHPR